MGPGLAVATTIAGTGLQVAGGLSRAKGEAAAYQHKEAQAQREARAARIAADQTDAFFRDELNTTLATIDAIRASSGVNVDSPTGQALRARETEVSDRQRKIKVGNLRMQADQSERDSAFYRYAAGRTLKTGYLDAFGTGIKGLAGLRR